MIPLRQHNTAAIIFVLAAFIALTVIFTFPLGRGFSSYIPAFSSTDEPYAAVWSFWWFAYAASHGQPLTDFTTIAAPFGQKNPPGAYLYWTALNQFLSLHTSPLVAYNLQVFASYILSGLFMYLLVVYVTGSRLSSFFAALIFAFSPYHAVRSWQHLGLAQIQWIPLCILALLVMYQRPTIRSALLCGAAFAAVMSVDLYYAYFMALVMCASVFFVCGYQRRLRPAGTLFGLLVIAGLVVVLICGMDLYHVLQFIRQKTATQASSGAYGYIRPFTDLFTQSARPLSYFLPAVFHPVLGKFTACLLGSPFYGQSMTEHTLYLGMIPLSLALLAVWQCRQQRLYRAFFIFLALFAWWCSQPPWWQIGGLRLPMPSFFLYKIFPMFRAYCRFGILVMLAVAVLAGMGLQALLSGLKHKAARIILAGVVSIGVLAEFWTYPPFKVIDVSVLPQVYYWLRNQPGEFTVAEYPLDLEGPDPQYQFFQTVHQKNIINATTPGTPAHTFSQSLTRLSQPSVAAVLKWMGVRYVLVHRQSYHQTGLVEASQELERIPGNPGLKLIKSFSQEQCPGKNIPCVRRAGEIDVYEVVAAATAPQTHPRRAPQ